MGRYDAMIKCTQVRKLLEENKYMKALEILKEIDIQKVHSISDLNVFARVYIKADQLDQARDIYLGIYLQHKSRQALYRLLMLTIRMGNIEEAEEYFDEYRELDPDGIDQYILQYRLAKAKGVNRSVRIAILEEMKKDEFREEWGYQLAKLYDKEGRTQDAVNLCNEIELWFGEGEYVDKARLLKAKCLGEPVEETYPGKMRFLDSKIEEQLPPPSPIPERIVENDDNRSVMDLAMQYDESIAPDNHEVTNEMPEAMTEPVEEAAVEPTIAPVIVEAAEGAAVEAVPVQAEEPVEPLAEHNKELYTSTESESLPVQDEEDDVIEEFLPPEKALKYCRLKQGLSRLRKKGSATHFALIGSDEALLITISKKIAKEVKALNILESSNIAKISADRLNKINLLEKMPKLSGNCILIQDTPLLSPESVVCIEEAIRVYNKKVIFIFAGEEDEMALWLKSHMALAIRIGIKVIL